MSELYDHSDHPPVTDFDEPSAVDTPYEDDAADMLNTDSVGEGDTDAEATQLWRTYAQDPGMSDGAQQQRSDILASVGHLNRPERVNMERITHFLDALDMHPVAEPLIIDSADAPQVQRAMTVVGARDARLNPDEHTGIYKSDIGLAITFVGPANNGEAELTTVHEYGVHGTSAGNHNIGFAMQHGGVLEGAFLEEGRAHLVETEYAQATGLILPDPIVPGASPSIDKYRSRSHYNYAGRAWDLMIAHDPQLLEPMLAASVGNEAYKEVAGRVDAIQPGLFDELTSMPHYTRGFDALIDNVHNFRLGLLTVSEALGIRPEDINRVINEGATTELIQQKLAVHSRQDPRIRW